MKEHSYFNIQVHTCAQA